MFTGDAGNQRISLQETALGRRRGTGELGTIFATIRDRLLRLTGSKSEERFRLAPFANNTSSIELDLICLASTRDLRSTESLLTEKISTVAETNRRLAERMSLAGDPNVKEHILLLKQKLESLRGAKKRLVLEIGNIELENETMIEHMTVGKSRVLQRLQNEIKEEQEVIEKMASELRYMTNRLAMFRGEKPRVNGPNAIRLPNLYGKLSAQQSHLPSLRPRASMPEITFETAKVENITAYKSDWAAQASFEQTCGTWPRNAWNIGQDVGTREIVPSPVDEIDEILSDSDLFSDQSL